MARAVRLDRASGRISMNIKLEAVIGGKHRRQSGRLDFDPGKALSLTFHDSSSKGTTNRTYLINGNRITVYDQDLNQAMRREVPAAMSVGDKLTFVFGNLPDPIHALTNATYMETLFDMLQKGRPFKLTSTSDGILLQKNWSKGQRTTTLRFNRAGRLSEFDGVVGASTLKWSVTYLDGFRLASIPAAAEGVVAFHPKPKPPRYETPETKRTVTELFSAEKHLGPTVVVVKGPNRNATIYWDGDRVRQQGGGANWAYDGRTLSVQNGKNFYRGKASHADVLDYLANLTHGEDSFARSLLLRALPFDDFFGPGESVKLVGHMAMNGQATDILQITGPALHASLYVRSTDHLVLGADAQSIGADKQELYHDQCSLSYKRLSDASKGTFQLTPPPGAKVKGLPKAAIRLSASG